MKLFPAAALTAGLCLAAPAFALVSGPQATLVENNARLSAVLSNTSPNKIVIDGELVTRVTGPDGAYDQQNTEDGALLLSPLTAEKFTVFIETASGLGVSVDVKPEAVNGRTLRLTPAGMPKADNDEAKAWEESQPWQKTLVSVARSVVNGGVPENYAEVAVSRAPRYQPAVPVTLTAERQLAGQHLRVVRYRLHNPGYVTQTLSEKQFWQKGVRAVMLSDAQLYAGGSGYAWVIFSNDGEAR